MPVFYILIASDKRTPQTILGQSYFINCTARFFRNLSMFLGCVLYHLICIVCDFEGPDVEFKGTGSPLSACSLIKLFFSNLFLILSVNNPTHMYLSDLREYFKVEIYFRVT